MTGALAGRECWLFDLDGTLVDSAPAHALAYEVALEELWPAARPAFRYGEHAGRPTAEVVAGLGVDPAVAGRVVARKQELYRAYVDEGAVLAVPGCAELLAALAGRRAYVVTGASRRAAERVLRVTGLAGAFGGVVAAEDAAAGKPDPAPYAEACRRWAPGGPGTAVAVEDSDLGVRSAVGAGLLTVHVGGPDGPGIVGVAGLHDLAGLLLGSAA